MGFMDFLGKRSAGGLSIEETLMALSKGAVLVDVRTQDEWRTVGVPDTSAARTAARFVEWNTAWGPNAEFLTHLEAAGAAVSVNPAIVL